LKIALVLDAFDRRTGGLANWTIGLANFLLGRGHDVHVVTFECAEPASSITLHLLEPGGSIFNRGARIADCIAGLAADVVHDTGTSWSGDIFQPQTGSRLNSFYADARGRTGMARLKRYLHPRMLWWQFCLLRLERRQMQAAQRVIAVSAMVRRVLAARHRIAPERLTIIHNGIDTIRFSPDAMLQLREAARRKLRLRDEVTFVMMANNFRLKNLATLLKALARLAPARPVLVVAGGEPDAFWQDQVARLGLTERVRFCGQVADPIEIYAAADCLVHPTRWDACSLAVLEALACGRPVITTAMDGSAEAVTDGESGYVIADPEDDAALAARMSDLLDPARRHRMGEAARLAGIAFDAAAQFAAVEAVLVAAASAKVRK
jgi:UDP-glucose:(heptosyl)LPS alpha-1,3-glucosyltransferase